MIRIAFVSDQPISALGLRTLLKDQTGIELIGEYRSNDHLMNQFEKNQPDVLILDCYLLFNPSDYLVRQINQSGFNMKICVLNQIIDEEHFLALVNARVNGYLLTNEPLHVIVTAIHRIAAGEMVVSAILEKFLNKNLLTGQDDSLRLTSREYEVLNLLASGYSNAQIADELYVSLGTVKNHSKSIYKKLNVHTRIEAVLSGLKHGLIGIK